MARDMLADVNYFGTMMVRAGDADGMVSGACHTTASTIRPGLQARRTACFRSDAGSCN
jgi:phosphate acetyltransferase